MRSATSVLPESGGIVAARRGEVDVELKPDFGTSWFPMAQFPTQE
jgi:hypothetical protein